MRIVALVAVKSRFAPAAGHSSTNSIISVRPKYPQIAALIAQSWTAAHLKLGAKAPSGR
jgi:hypothetical protein